MSSNNLKEQQDLVTETFKALSKTDRIVLIGNGLVRQMETSHITDRRLAIAGTHLESTAIRKISIRDKNFIISGELNEDFVKRLEGLQGSKVLTIKGE